jgi:hypothetical protein
MSEGQKMKYPRECPVFEMSLDGDYAPKGEVVEGVTEEPRCEIQYPGRLAFVARPEGYIGVWAPRTGYYFGVPVEQIRPLTPAAREMLKLVKP